MRREGLMARTRRRFRPCNAKAGNDAVAENVLDRQFQPSEPNRCWAGDITYIRTTEGWRYLAVSGSICSPAASSAGNSAARWRHHWSRKLWSVPWGNER